MANKPTEEAANQARRLIAASLTDFLTYMVKQREPILVGGQYKPDKFLAVFVEWCKLRGFDSSDPDTNAWLQLCIGGYMGGTTKASETPLTGLQGPGHKKPRSDSPGDRTPPKRPPMDLNADNTVDPDQPPPYDDTPNRHRRQAWEDEGEDWKNGKSPEEDTDG